MAPVTRHIEPSFMFYPQEGRVSRFYTNFFRQPVAFLPQNLSFK